MPRSGEPALMRALQAAAALGFVLLIGLLALPLAGLVTRIPLATLLERLQDPAVLEALRLSLTTSIASTMIVVLLGLPVAHQLASRNFPGKRLIELLVDLPMVLPPTVAGVALLTAFGRAGLAGGALKALGITLPFTTLGVVVAQAFVAAPFFIRASRAGLSGVDRRYLDAAATLRSPPFLTFVRIMLPLALPSLLAGAAMSWARALGEFGATITFAGNMPGITQTMPLAVYIALQSDLDAAIALSILLLAVSIAVLLVVRLIPADVALPFGHAGRRSR